MMSDLSVEVRIETLTPFGYSLQSLVLDCKVIFVQQTVLIQTDMVTVLRSSYC